MTQEQTADQTDRIELGSDNTFFQIMFPDACGIQDTTTHDGKIADIAEALAFDASRTDEQNKKRLEQFDYLCVYIGTQMPRAGQAVYKSMEQPRTLEEKESRADTWCSFNQGQQDSTALLLDACQSAHAKTMSAEKIQGAAREHIMYLSCYASILTKQGERLIEEGAHLAEQKRQLASANAAPAARAAPAGRWPFRRNHRHPGTR